MIWFFGWIEGVIITPAIYVSNICSYIIYITTQGGKANGNNFHDLVPLSKCYSCGG